MSQVNPFHVAVPVHDLAECKTFYTELLDCKVGRESDHWIDLDLMGHQFVLHLDPSLDPKTVKQHCNPVNGKQVPVPHYGVILTLEHWKSLAEHLRQHKIDFIIEPYIRFEGQPGEQATMFFMDPAGNALEFKAFADFSQIFAK
ncbi:VOC family protein [Pleionea mediterranea]|uniref:VOC domain-containing protein n=1 Tax=Pleionea mediterranea TaxID=523701 RepID=A0A316FRF4_9GAMM|nr:VOC family protein [Pleionea mediterranea]PWK50762.1 hypothetical protein C8D97_10649 [Pleionea mediterranea]